MVKDMKLPEIVFDVIKSRRTIRKFKQVPIDDNKMIRIIKAGMFAPYFGGKEFFIRIFILEKWARNRAVNIITQTYSIARDVALISKILPEDKKEWWKNYIQKFLKDLGNAPYIIIGVVPNEKEEYPVYYASAWAVAEAMMIQAVAEGLATGSITFISQSVQRELLENVLNLEPNRYYVAFALNLGYPDEEPISKSVNENLIQIME